MDEREQVVAIDGPSGAGKSTVAREVAARLGFHYVDTGAMYRALTLLALERGIPVDDEAALVAAARAMSFAFGPGQAVLLDGRDVAQAIRTPEVTQAVSPVSAHPAVRELLVERQRQLGRKAPSVVEGRDIGSVVFPNAAVKIYLTANVEDRAQRRLRELQDRGIAAGGAADVATDLERRDQHDSTRAASPLAMAADAVLLDTSRLTRKEAVEAVLTLCRERAVVPLSQLTG